jgi:hypothetical protein
MLFNVIFIILVSFFQTSLLSLLSLGYFEDGLAKLLALCIAVNPGIIIFARNFTWTFTIHDKSVSVAKYTHKWFTTKCLFIGVFMSCVHFRHFVSSSITVLWIFAFVVCIAAVCKDYAMIKTIAALNYDRLLLVSQSTSTFSSSGNNLYKRIPVECFSILCLDDNVVSQIAISA